MTEDRRGWCYECRDYVADRHDRKLLAREHNGHMIGFSEELLLNPENTPWMPGYRFRVSQDAKTGGRRGHHRKSRTYNVYWNIDKDGNLVWAGGVAPTERTRAMVEEMYAQRRPGSNWYPGAGE